MLLSIFFTTASVVNVKERTMTNVHKLFVLSILLLNANWNGFGIDIVSAIGKLSCELSRPRGYKTFFMLNSTEHEIFPAHTC